MMTENSGDRLLESVDQTIDRDRFPKVAFQIREGCGLRTAIDALAIGEDRGTGHVI